MSKNQIIRLYLRDVFVHRLLTSLRRVESALSTTEDMLEDLSSNWDVMRVLGLQEVLTATRTNVQSLRAGVLPIIADKVALPKSLAKVKVLRRNCLALTIDGSWREFVVDCMPRVIDHEELIEDWYQRAANGQAGPAFVIDRIVVADSTDLCTFEELSRVYLEEIGERPVYLEAPLPTTDDKPVSS